MRDSGNFDIPAQPAISPAQCGQTSGKISAISPRRATICLVVCRSPLFWHEKKLTHSPSRYGTSSNQGGYLDQG